MRIVAREHLEVGDVSLLEEAERIAKTAYANHSHYCVGAALLVRTPGGERLTVSGNNFETLTYKSVCAEKHAVMKAYALYSEGEGAALERPFIEKVAVYCGSGGEPQQPCGDCRQTLFEVNPDMQVIAAAGASGELHDARVTITSLRELLPHGFELIREGGLQLMAGAETLVEPSELAAHVVHFPKPAELEHDAEARAALLTGVSAMLLVGSPGRARAVAEYAEAQWGATGGCYCDLSRPEYAETVREFAVYVVELDGARIAVVSHGVGEAGVEIVLSELPALLELVSGQAPDIRGVFRAGTRGTLAQVPLGSIALSTSTFNDDLDRLEPADPLVEAVREAARGMGMTVLDEDATASLGVEGLEGVAPQKLLLEGVGLSTRFFWRGQARPIYRADPAHRKAHQADRRQRLGMLQRWVRKGIQWIEMEDFAVHEIAAACGYRSVTLGAVIAHRRAQDGAFQVDYSKEMYKKSELIPPLVALRAASKL